MVFFFISIVAGVLTILAPCILPLLPIVIGTTETDHKHISKRSVVVIASLTISVFAFTLLLKASTLLIHIPQSFWSYFSGSVIILLGIFLLFPSLWSSIPYISKLNQSSNLLVGSGYKRHDVLGDMLIGAALGPVFTTCSPTYLFIIATALPASYITGLFYLLGFLLGLVTALLLVAYFGQQIITALTKQFGKAELVKQLFAGLIIVVGVAIMTGYDKKIETWILDAGYGATIDLEEQLIHEFRPVEKEVGGQGETSVEVPRYLQAQFPDTDWSLVGPKMERAMSGGPAKDGIPALTDPAFIPIADFVYSDDIPAIFIADGDIVKVYPYNILNWHEIINDTVNDTPVAVTFCPLCGSAIVFDRTIADEVTTFGVSGSLIDSNMLMYDRATESLWQQSTGVGLAGTHTGAQLRIVSMQLSTVGEIRSKYPHALIVGDETGHKRAYDRDPYAGYTTDTRFVFDPGGLDDRYHPKEVFLVFETSREEIIAVRNLVLSNGTLYTIDTAEESYRVTKNGDEVTIANGEGEHMPFYYEMWFSITTQHKEAVTVFDPELQ